MFARRWRSWSCPDHPKSAPGTEDKGGRYRGVPVGCVSEAAAATMGRAELQHVLKECGASCLKDICDLLEDESDGRADIISVLKSDACHAAAAQADSAPALSTVTLHVTVSAPPPPPPSIKVVMQITVPKPSTADVGSAT